MTKQPRHFEASHPQKPSYILFPSFPFMGAPKKKIMRLAEMNKESGPAKKLVPIQYPPFADNKSLIFRHFARYLCQPMLKLQRELLFLIDSRKR